MSTSVPVPFLVRLPVPVIPLELKVDPCVTVSERLNNSVPLLIIELVVASDPTAPLFPICNVPASMVVAPV